MDKKDVIELFETVLTSIVCPLALPIVINMESKEKKRA